MNPDRRPESPSPEDRPPLALTIAGSDSGGGAGIQADLKTFFAFGVFGTSAVTAITAQNTRGVQGVHPVPLEMVREQIDSVVDDLRPAALKSGMLATAELVSTVARAIADHDLENFVLDPVMVATSGDRLLDEDAVEAVTGELLPLAALVTPNLHEARILTGLPVESQDGMREAASRLLEMGAGAALVKGGHLEEDEAVDLFFDGREEREWRRERIETVHTHGTGCTLSAACAAGLARGAPLPQAVGAAVDYVARAIASAPGLGSGHGPVNHFVDPSVLPGPDRPPGRG
ncbi:MAG: bifunctional hydroxymethylpyrimidine kinase/phosphomethylpyrimidine kinase [Longimicrobiales bacterium]|nr:bifunctional hydroxymethylpyrimidine kinase/phosphomethylpyrimidine kinase [Longimicrobiales bacterium]